MMPSFTLEDFNLWKSLPVTKALFSLCSAEIEHIKKELTSESLILRPHGQLRQALICGEKKSFETIISLSYEEIVDDSVEGESLVL